MVTFITFKLLHFYLTSHRKFRTNRCITLNCKEKLLQTFSFHLTCTTSQKFGLIFPMECFFFIEEKYEITRPSFKWYRISILYIKHSKQNIFRYWFFSHPTLIHNVESSEDRCVRTAWQCRYKHYCLNIMGYSFFQLFIHLFYLPFGYWGSAGDIPICLVLLCLSFFLQVF